MFRLSVQSSSMVNGFILHIGSEIRLISKMDCKSTFYRARGGDFDPWVEKGMQMTCCTDGIRPVSFKLERLEE